jgi:chromosome segregation ATPase
MADDFEPIPSIVAEVDEERRPSQTIRRTPSSAGSTAGRVITATFVFVALAVALGSVIWSWQLQQQLVEASHIMERHNARIMELEAAIADTDEGLSQNAAQMAVRIKELYSEVDKLWASAWRRNKADIEALQTAAGNHDKALKALVSADKTAIDERTQNAAMIDLLRKDMAKLKSVASDLERLASSASSNQSALERTADNVNKLTLQFSALSKRVEGNEEWIGSINAFRRQVNTTLTELQRSVRELETPPTAVPSP